MPIQSVVDLLRNKKLPWTEALIAMITRLMSNETFYTDCLGDLDQILPPNEKIDIKFLKIDQEFLKSRLLKRRAMISDLESLQDVISQNESVYKQIRITIDKINKDENNEKSILKKTSSDIHYLKFQFEQLRNEYEGISLKVKDISILKEIYHYASSTSARSESGKRGNTLINCFKTLSGPEFSTINLLIDFYSMINNLAGQRERMLGSTENIVIKDQNGLYNKTTNKPLSDEMRILKMTTYHSGIKLFVEGFVDKIKEFLQSLPGDTQKNIDEKESLTQLFHAAEQDLQVEYEILSPFISNENVMQCQ